MKRAGVRYGELVCLPSEKSLRTRDGKASRMIAPDNSVEYADVGGDWNPIHINTTFARFAGFQTAVYHGNHTNALVLQLIRREIPGTSPTTIRRYSANNTAVLFPGDSVSMVIKHFAMDRDCSVLSCDVRRDDTEEFVLSEEVNLDGPRSSFLFTVQGSQFAGIGLREEKEAELEPQNPECGEESL